MGFNVWKMFKDDIIVGQCICNDRRWPETFRVMGLKGAEMVVLGYNTPTDNVYAPKEPPYLRVFHHNLSIQAAAYQNGIWVVATAKAGKEDGFWLHGGTAIVAPTGEIVAKSNTEEDEVVSYDCDMELGEYIRNTTFNFAKHRRPEHYKLIVERTGVKVEPSNELGTEDLLHAIRRLRRERSRALQAPDLLRAAAADRLGDHDRADGDGQRRAVQLLQRLRRGSAARHVRHQQAAGRASQGHLEQHRAHRPVRRQPDRRAAGARHARIRAATSRPTPANPTILA